MPAAHGTEVVGVPPPPPTVVGLETGVDVTVDCEEVEEVVWTVVGTVPGKHCE